jgi:hypothetical protein
MKRESSVTRASKRIKLESYNAASSIHNYMLNDPILDWIKNGNQNSNKTKKRGTKNTNLDDTDDIDDLDNNETNFFNFITQQGNKFEKGVIGVIKKVLKKNKFQFLQVSYGPEDIKSPNKYQETIDAINNQVHVIYQAVLHGNNNFKAYGSPDLLIRSDIVKHLFDQDIDSVPMNGTKYNYVVVDIKFCTLHLRSDAKCLLNTARMPANKGQIIIYNKLLGIVQGHTPDYCYVLGRGWKYTQKGETFVCDRFDERLGCIDVNGKDKMYNDKVKDGLNWLERVKTQGSKFEYCLLENIEECVSCTIMNGVVFDEYNDNTQGVQGVYVSFGGLLAKIPVKIPLRQDIILRYLISSPLDKLEN